MSPSVSVTFTTTCCVLQDKSPNYDSYCMLAEAYMSLQEPDKAAAAYEVGLTHISSPLSPAWTTCNVSWPTSCCVLAPQN
jgi:hypothetical protein